MSLLSGREYADANVTYGWRGGAFTAGVLKRRTGNPGTGWYFYLGGGVAASGLSVSLTFSLNAVSTGWNAALSQSGGAMAYQVGLDAVGTPFTEGGFGGPRGTSLVAYRVWPVR